MLKIDELIKVLLMLDGNETSFLSRESQYAFENLIIQVSRIKYGIRYHQYDRECSCQPECNIKEIIEDSEIKEFLKQEKVLEDIKKLLDEPINKDVTVWGEA